MTRLRLWLVLAFVIGAVVPTQEAKTNNLTSLVGFPHHFGVTTKFTSAADSRVKSIVVFNPTPHAAEGFAFKHVNQKRTQNVVGVPDYAAVWGYNQFLKYFIGTNVQKDMIILWSCGEKQEICVVNEIPCRGVAGIFPNRVKFPAYNFIRVPEYNGGNTHFFEINKSLLSDNGNLDLLFSNFCLSFCDSGLLRHQFPLPVSDTSLSPKYPSLEEQYADSDPFVRVPWLWAVITAGIPISF